MVPGASFLASNELMSPQNDFESGRSSRKVPPWLRVKVADPRSSPVSTDFTVHEIGVWPSDPTRHHSGARSSTGATCSSCQIHGWLALILYPKVKLQSDTPPGSVLLANREASAEDFRLGTGREVRLWTSGALRVISSKCQWNQLEALRPLALHEVGSAKACLIGRVCHCYAWRDLVALNVRTSSFLRRSSVGSARDGSLQSTSTGPAFKGQLRLVLYLLALNASAEMFMGVHSITSVLCHHNYR